MVKILVSFLLVIFASGIQKVYDVIIIGAGLSGASASRILTQRGIPHLMLEARNRTGGRILSGTF
jgi:monoamine oxidase